MSPADNPIDGILRALQERAKELDCLYKIEDLLLDEGNSLRDVLLGIVRIIPSGWQYPHQTAARILYRGDSYAPEGFRSTPWVLSAPIRVQAEEVGALEVYYLEPMPRQDEGPFLKEERRLINSIADRLGLYLTHRHLGQAMERMEKDRSRMGEGAVPWEAILGFLKRTDRGLLMRITRKMLNHLAWQGAEEAVRLLQSTSPGPGFVSRSEEDENRPLAKRQLEDYLRLTDATFRIARSVMTDEEIVSRMQGWIAEDKSRFLIQTLENRDSTLPEIRAALSRYHHAGPDSFEIPAAARKGIQVSLIHRFFNEQIDFINSAKRYIVIDDFFELMETMVYPPRSHGKVGGKSTGLFWAMAVLRSVLGHRPEFAQVRSPRTWYLATDGLLEFIRRNNLEDVYNQKYAEIEQVRQEYPHIVQLFKNSPFPAEILDGLSVALDDLEGRPLIVRSSSLLEDRLGAAFSGKYKSLFLANQGSKRQRLSALTDAIAEVYASIFGPDPIEYRAARGLIDVYEEMGIMIQEVVGTRVGRYWLPAFSGVAFSNNEFRWSHRIRRQDGLVRLVPGLGTRAVDRLKDDYPVLLSPGQPGLRANVTPDEILRYSPKMIDVINLESGKFETVSLESLLREFGGEYPMLRQVISLFDGEHIRAPAGLIPDLEKETAVVTFEGLVRGSAFMATMQAMLQELQSALGVPVDLEFAHDGEHFYLLQCRPQSHAGDAAPGVVPRDLPDERVLFSARRYVSHGRVSGIRYLVYIDPASYADLPTLEEMKAVGRAVGRLNNLLPKRRFILMGPGRWGSRGDIKLGVSVTYADISNTAVLAEVARKKGNYVPDLSFGTHFFQDLVESSIRYLPLYPDDEGIVFREQFFLQADNALPRILPEYASLQETIRVIDIPRETGGMTLSVFMNADQDIAVGALVPEAAEPEEIIPMPEPQGRQPAEQYWRWRLRFAERIAADLDPRRFGVAAMYVLGSTKNANAGPGSDIDLLVHFRGDERQREDLLTWFDGWSRCLSEINYLRTGSRTQGLLDVHLVSDEDIKNRTSWAVKIGAVTDSARELQIGRRDH